VGGIKTLIEINALSSDSRRQFKYVSFGKHFG
jgi:hypothetical protein